MKGYLIASYSTLFFILLSSCNVNKNKILPILGDRSTVTRIVDGKTTVDTIYKTIPTFRYVNQYGDSITNKNLDDKIYVADFFFTTCPSICPVMARNMLNVYNIYKSTGDVKILSYTIDPQHDSVPILKKYADKLNVNGNMWLFLQGRKDQTYMLGKSYLVSIEEKNPAGEYIHDGYFILVDKQKRIRGMYMGTKPEEVAKLVEDIKTLKEEYTNQATK